MHAQFGEERQEKFNEITSLHYFGEKSTKQHPNHDISFIFLRKSFRAVHYCIIISNRHG